MSDNGLKATFLENRTVLTRFLVARGVRSDEAEDLVQDLYLKLESTHTGPVTEPRAYLFRMANNLFLDRRRAMVASARRDHAWSTDATDTFSDIDARPAADEQLIAQERLGSVVAALGQLPEITVQIFRRFRLEGEKQKDIARDLGVSLATVEKHLQRAYRVVLDAKTALDTGLDG